MSPDAVIERQKRIFPKLSGKKERKPAKERIARTEEIPVTTKEEIESNAGLAFAAAEGNTGNALPPDEWDSL